MRRLTFLTLAAVLLLPRVAAAECLPDARRAAFERELRSLFAASTLDVDALEAHANNRLGFGARAAQGASTQTAAERRAALAADIAASLETAAVVSRGVDDDLAALAVTPRVPDASPYVWRHAAGGMTEAYSEYHLWIEASREETDPDEKVRLRRLGAIALGNSREAAKARVAAQLLLSGAPDLGELFGEMWFNHFNVSASKAGWATVDYQKAIRRNVCSTFRAMLGASARHPAMAMYLDNFRSRAGNINENYGRELLELHTLGDDRYRYYTQDDVIGVARALTGWGVGFDELDATTVRPRFRFYAASHDPARLDLFGDAPSGVRLVLPAARLVRGVPVAAAVQRGEALLDYLASHRATRRNICIKISRRLLGNAPGPIVDGCVADAVWGDEGDLGAIYRYFLTRPEMWSSDHNKLKNPIELVVSAHRRTMLPRATVLEVRYLRDVLTAVESLGIAIADVPPPTGYDDDNAWLSPGLLLRWRQIAFAELDTGNLGWRVADRTLRGAELETYVRDEVAAAEAAANPNAALTALGERLAVEMLGFPASERIAAVAVQDSLRLPDNHTGQRAVVASFVETALAARFFIRK